MKKYSICLLLLLSLACKKNQEISTPKEPEHFVPHAKEEAQQTYHEDTIHKFEYRTGESGDYQYNYDVSGTNDKGDEVTGNVTIQAKYGKGTLTNDAGDEIEVEVEWIGLGKLSATDSDGNEYELDVD